MPDLVVALSLGPQRASSIRSILRRGLRLCVVDVYPYLSPPNQGDYWCAARSADTGSLLEALQRTISLSDVCAVVTFREHLVIEASRLSGYLGLPGLQETTAVACRDKSVMRRAWTDAGIPQPGFAAALPGDLQSALASVGFPAVVKPLDGTAGRGVVPVLGPTDLDRLLTDVPAHQTLLVEEYLSGPEFSVELVLFSGQACFASVTAKDIAGQNGFVEVGHTVPAPISEQLRRELVDCAVRSALALGVHQGVLHVEMKATQSGPTPIELAARPAADFIPELVFRATGVDLYGAAVDMARGIPPAVDVTPSGGASIAYGLSCPGTVLGVSGLDRALFMPGVVQAEVLVHPGQTIHSRSNHDRGALVMTGADEPERARHQALEALAEIRVDVLPREDE